MKQIILFIVFIFTIMMCSFAQEAPSSPIIKGRDNKSTEFFKNKKLQSPISPIFLAGACALSLSGLIAPEIYDRFFAQQVTQAIAARLPDLSGAATAAQQAHAALESLPDVIAQFAASLGIDTAALAQKILSADLSGAALAQTLADSIARPLVTLLCRLALFVGLILIFGILFRILAAVIDRFFHLPVLRTANAALGGVMGALKGLLVVLVAGVALQLAANLFASPGAAFQQTVESSFVMGMVRELLLVSGIAS